MSGQYGLGSGLVARRVVGTWRYVEGGVLEGLEMREVVNWVAKLGIVAGYGFGLKMGVLETEDLEEQEGELVSQPLKRL